MLLPTAAKLYHEDSSNKNNRAACAGETAGPCIALNKNKKSTTNYSAICTHNYCPHLSQPTMYPLSIYICPKGIAMVLLLPPRR